MKVSVVMAYYNRRKHLINTLRSIEKTSNKNFEVIVVDDASDYEHEINDLTDIFPFLKVFRILPEEKKHINPCISYNIGFNNAEGEIILIQNPECFHKGDILSHVLGNLKESDYNVYSCFSLDENKTEEFHKNIEVDVNKFITNKPVDSISSDGWYQHSIHRPVGYHFASAIFKTKLKEIGGFDEEYAYGIGYDDDDFLRNVKKICQVNFFDYPFVLHQYHYKDTISDEFRKNYTELVNKNKNIFYRKK